MPHLFPVDPVLKDKDEIHFSVCFEVCVFGRILYGNEMMVVQVQDVSKNVCNFLLFLWKLINFVYCHSYFLAKHMDRIDGKWQRKTTLLPPSSSDMQGF